MNISSLKFTLQFNCALFLFSFFGLNAVAQNNLESINAELKKAVEENDLGKIGIKFLPELSDSAFDDDFEAKALKGVLNAMLGNDVQARKDLLSVYLENKRLRIQLPVRATSPQVGIEGFSRLSMTERCVDELLFEILVEKGGNFSFAAAVAGEILLRLEEETAAREVVTLFRRDEHICKLFSQPAFNSPTEEYISELAKLVFDYDAVTEKTTVLDSKCAGRALLTIAKFAKETEALPQNCPQLSSIQLVLLATSLPSVSDTLHTDATILLSQLFKEKGYLKSSLRLERYLSKDSRKQISVCFDAAKLLSSGETEKCRAVLLNEYAQPTELKLVLENVNPVFLKNVVINSPTQTISLFEVLPTKRPFHFSNRSSTRLQAFALYACSLWSGSDGNADDLDLALQIGLKLCKRITSTEFLSLEDEEAKSINPMKLLLEPLFEEQIPDDTAEFLDVCFRLYSFGEHDASLDLTALEKLISTNESLQSSRYALALLCKKLMRSGLHEDAEKWLGLWKARIPNDPYCLLNYAEFERRQGRPDAMLQLEKDALQLFKGQFEILPVPSATLRLAMKSKNLLLSSAAQREISKLLAPHFSDVVETSERTLLLNELSATKVLHADADLARVLKEILDGALSTEWSQNSYQQWQLALSAYAYSGGPKSKSCLCEIVEKFLSEDSVAGSWSRANKYLFIRAVTEAMITRDPNLAQEFMTRFFEKEPAFLKIARPLGHQITISRSLPLGQFGSDLAEIYRDTHFSHILGNIEELNGKEYLEFLAFHAGLRLGSDAAPSQRLAELGRNPSLLGSEGEEDGEMVVLEEYQKIVLACGTTFDQEVIKEWWKTKNPNEIIECCNDIIDFRNEHQDWYKENGDIKFVLQAYHARAQVNLSVLSAKDARSDIAILIKFNQESTLADAYQYFQLPFLSKHLSLLEAQALASIYDKTNEADLGPFLKLLAASEAFANTSLKVGLDAAMRLAKRPLVTKNPSLQAEWFFDLETIKRSGLAPVIRGSVNPIVPAEIQDLTYSLRLKNLASGENGFRVPFVDAGSNNTTWECPYVAEVSYSTRLGWNSWALNAGLNSWMNQQIGEASGPIVQSATAKMEYDVILNAVKNSKLSESSEWKTESLRKLMTLCEKGCNSVVEGDFESAESEFLELITLDYSNNQFAIQRRLCGNFLFEGANGQEVQPLSLGMPNGTPYSHASFDWNRAQFSVTAFRNLSILYQITGDFDRAVTTYSKVLEFEKRSPWKSHIDRGFAPEELASSFPEDLATLRKGTESLLNAGNAIASQGLLRAKDLLADTPKIFRKTRQYLQIHASIKLHELSTLDPVTDEYSELAKECEEFLVTFPSYPVSETFVSLVAKLQENEVLGSEPVEIPSNDRCELRDPSILLLRSSIKLPNESEKLSTEAIDLLDVVLPEILESFKGESIVPGNRIAPWIPVFLHATPELLHNYGKVLEVQNPAKLSSIRLAYSNIVKFVVNDKSATPFHASLVLRPLCRSRYSSVDDLLRNCIPTTEDGLAQLAIEDASGMSKLHWVIAAAIRSGGESTMFALQSQVKARKPESSAYFQLFRAYAILNPTDAASVGIKKVLWKDVDLQQANSAAESEAVLKFQLDRSFERGTQFTCTSIDLGQETWFRDADAFWFIDVDEPSEPFCNSLLKLIDRTVETPQEFAAILPEIESLSSLERLGDFSSLDADSMAGIFHKEIARMLSVNGSPMALAILLRYCDQIVAQAEEGEASKPLALNSAFEVAMDQDYTSLAHALWLADIPNSKWEHNIKRSAWSKISQALPAEIKINAPAPKSRFIQALKVALKVAVESGEKVPRFVEVGEPSLQVSLCSDFIRKVLVNHPELKRPLSAANLEGITDFAMTLQRAKLTIKEACMHHLEGTLDEESVEAEAENLAEQYIREVVYPMTIKLYALASTSHMVSEKMSEVRLLTIAEKFEERFEIWAKKNPNSITRINDKDFTDNNSVRLDDNEFEYKPTFTLTKRELFLPTDGETIPRYQETFSFDGDSITVRGPVPFSYLASIVANPRILELLGVSLAKREFINQQLAPSRLTLDLALKAPDLAWPVLVQETGYAHVGEYLSTADLFPSTAMEWMKKVDATSAATSNVEQRIANYRSRNRKISEAYFYQSYSNQALSRAHEIPDKIKEKICWLKVGEKDNEAKKSFVANAISRRRNSFADLKKYDGENLFRIVDTDDPPRYVQVVETSFSDDYQSWFCRYRIITARQNVIVFEQGGEVDKLPWLCQQLAIRNPAIVKRLRLDLGGLTMDPVAQVMFAAKCTANIETGANSVIRVMNRFGITEDEIRSAIVTDNSGELGDKFERPQEWLLRLKDTKIRDLAETAGLLNFDAQDLQEVDEQVFVNLASELNASKSRIQSDAIREANRQVGRVQAASADVNYIGIPNLLCLTFHGNKLVGGSVVVALSGDIETPSSFEFVFPVSTKPQVDTTAYPGNKLIDPRLPFELSDQSNKVEPAEKENDEDSVDNSRYRLLSSEFYETSEIFSLENPVDPISVEYITSKFETVGLLSPAGSSSRSIPRIYVFVNGMFNSRDIAEGNARLVANDVRSDVILCHNPPNQNGGFFDNLAGAFFEKLGISQEKTARECAEATFEIMNRYPDTMIAWTSHSEGEAKTENIFKILHKKFENSGMSSVEAHCRIVQQISHLSMGGAYEPSRFENKVRIVQYLDHVSKTATFNDPIISLFNRDYYWPKTITKVGISIHSFDSYMNLAQPIEQFHFSVPLPKYCEPFSRN